MAAVAVADTVRDGPPSGGPDGASRMWGRGGACTTALVSPAPGTPAAGSSAAASFFVRYGARGRLDGNGVGSGGGTGPEGDRQEVGVSREGPGGRLPRWCGPAPQPGAGGPCPRRGPRCVGATGAQGWLCPGRPAWRGRCVSPGGAGRRGPSFCPAARGADGGEEPSAGRPRSSPVLMSWATHGGGAGALLGAQGAAWPHWGGWAGG